MAILELTFLLNRTEIKSGAIHKRLPLEHQHVLPLLHKGSFCRQQPHEQRSVGRFIQHTSQRGLKHGAGNCDSDLLLSREGIGELCLQAGCKQSWVKPGLSKGQPLWRTGSEPSALSANWTEEQRWDDAWVRIHLWTQMEADGKQSVSVVSLSKCRGGDSGQRKALVNQLCSARGLNNKWTVCYVLWSNHTSRIAAR